MPSKDPIKRRLDLLDEHLKETSSLTEAFLEQSPLVFAACGIISGIALANYLKIPVWLPLSMLAVNTLVCAYLLRKFEYRRIAILSFLVFSSFLFLGTLRLIIFNTPPATDISNYVKKDRQLATLRGTVMTDIRREDRSSWKFANYLPLSPSSSFYLDIQQIKTHSSWADITGKVRVNVSARLEGISAGDKVEVYCTLSKFAQASNPGQFQIAKYMKRKSVLYGAGVYSPAGVKVIKKDHAALTKLRYKLKTLANTALFSDSQMENENAGLLAALLLGTRSKIDAGTYEAFRRTGLSHFISLSGMHMAILAFILWLACKYTGLPKPYRAAICIALIILYILTIPPRSPSLRAAVICCFFFLSIIVRRKPNSLNTLSLAAIILLLSRPASLFQPGWQLSFTCVAGIILFYKHIEHFIISNTTDRFSFFKSTHQNPAAIFLQSFSSKTIGLLSAGLAAWIGGSGVMLYHFSTITPLAFLWTVTIYGFIILILPLGFFKILLSGTLPTLSMLLGFALDFLSNWLIKIVKIIAEHDFSQMVIGKVPVLVIIAFYLYILLLRFWHTDRRFLRKTVLNSLAIGLTVSVLIIKFAPHQRDTLQITCLDVGHGQAIAAFFPDGSKILFDTGSLTAKNSGASIVVPFLQTKGISRLDGIIASHEDIDHINGIPEVVNRYKSASVYANAAMLDQLESSPKIRHLNDSLMEVSSGLKPIGKYHNKYITPLWPPYEIAADPDISSNDKSQVSLIKYAGKNILICSDIEIFAQTKIFQTYPDLKADIIVMPHHGSRTNLLENYAEKLEAKIAVISCARNRLNNSWKPPAQIDTYYSPIHGAITIKINKNGQIGINTYK